MTSIQPSLRQQLAVIGERCGGEVTFFPGGAATLTGTTSEVAQLLRAIRLSGRLVSSTAPVPTGVNGYVLVNVRFAPRLQPHAFGPAEARRRLPRWAFWSIIAGVVAVVVGFVWLMVIAVKVALSNLPVLLIAGLVVTVIVVLGARSGRGKTFSGTFQGKID